MLLSVSTFQFKKAVVLSICPGVVCKYPCAPSTSLFLFRFSPSFFVSLFLSLSFSRALFLSRSLSSVLVYASDFVERREQPKGFLLHKTSLLMSSVVLITSHAGQCVFLTRDLLPGNVTEEIEMYHKPLLGTLTGFF